MSILKSTDFACLLSQKQPVNLFYTKKRYYIKMIVFYLL